MYPYFIALVIYLLIKVYISSTYILTISWSCTNFFSFFKRMQEFFFLVQFRAWIFFWIWHPPPRISNGPPLIHQYKQLLWDVARSAGQYACASRLTRTIAIRIRTLIKLVSINYLHMPVPIGGREFDKKRDRELLKRLYNLTPKVMVILMEISINCGNAARP